MDEPPGASAHRRVLGSPGGQHARAPAERGSVERRQLRHFEHVAPPRPSPRPSLALPRHRHSDGAAQRTRPHRACALPSRERRQGAAAAADGAAQRPCRPDLGGRSRDSFHRQLRQAGTAAPQTRC